MQKESELLIITKAKELTDYIFTVTQKSPKSFRFSIVSRLQNISLDIITFLYQANDTPCVPQSIAKRYRLQCDAMTSLRLLAYISELGCKQGAILPKQLEQIAKNVLECRRLLGGWINSDRRRMMPQ